MNDYKPRELTRRQFLITAGGTASALTFGCSRAPPSTPTAGSPVSTPQGTPASAGLPALALTAANSGSFGWTFGHMFRQGDVPGGSYLAAISGASNLQADIRNFWPDGSVKYAVLSGISGFTVDSATAVQLGTSNTPPSGSNVPEPTSAQIANVAVELMPTATKFSIPRAVTLRLSDVIGVDLPTWDAGSAGRVRQIPGRVMSEFHYYQPVNSLLHVWWYVRAYSNGAIEIERVIENGFWEGSGAGAQSQQDYNVSSYTNSSTSPDYQAPYIGRAYPSDPEGGITVYSCPATGELLVNGGTSAIVAAGDVPAANVACYLNGDTSTIYTVTQANTAKTGAPAWSANASFAPRQFVSHSGNAYQATTAVAEGQAPSGTTSSNAYWDYVPGSNAGEYCWMKVSGSALPLSVVGDATISSMFLIGHFAHTQWSRVDWINGVAVTPAHNTAYLLASKVVPNYGFLNPDGSAWGGPATANRPLASGLNPTPFELGDVSAVMGNAGYHAHIGVLPQWEALYCTSAAPQAYDATVSNFRRLGRWQIFRRDITTGRPVNYLSYPNAQMVSNGQSDDGPPSGGNNGEWDIAHHPSAGYLAYLVEGRWSQFETLAFAASLAIMYSAPTWRQNGGVIAVDGVDSTRGAAWAWRTMAQAASASPRYLGGSAPPNADGNLTSAYVQSVHDTALWHNQRYVEGSTYNGQFQNAIGWLGQADQYVASPTGQQFADWWGAHWMVNYQSMALSNAYEMSIEGLSNQATDLLAIAKFSCLNAVLATGTNSTFNFRCGVGLYDRPYLQAGSAPSAPMFLSIEEQFSTYLSELNLPLPRSDSPGDFIYGPSEEVETGAVPGSPFFDDFSTGYCLAHISVLALAVDLGVSGGQAAYSLATSASNYAPDSAIPTASDAPQFGFIPRS